ncbi:MAG: cation:proton antiporter, partial [Pseudomonadota bacterium]
MAEFSRVLDLLRADPSTAGEVAVRGWLRSKRDSKAGISFLAVHDGSAFDAIQAVVPADLDNYEELLQLTTGCSVEVHGELVASQGKGQAVEIQASGVNVLGWVDDQRRIFLIAEVGVALLLFVIGLEFSPRRLWEFGPRTMVVGVLQVVVTAGIGFAAARAFGLDPRAATVVGLMVAMSSTACVLRLLAEHGELDSAAGRTSLAILLVQDIAVVPMMLVVS